VKFELGNFLGNQLIIIYLILIVAFTIRISDSTSEYIAVL